MAVIVGTALQLGEDGIGKLIYIFRPFGTVRDTSSFSHTVIGGAHLFGSLQFAPGPNVCFTVFNEILIFRITFGRVLNLSHGVDVYSCLFASPRILVCGSRSIVSYVDTFHVLAPHHLLSDQPQRCVLGYASHICFLYYNFHLSCFFIKI